MSDLVSHDSPPSRLERLADLAPALGLLLFHLALLPGYGVFRDELYYMACGRHPAWGYVDHPPLVGWVAWAVRQLAGDSHLALRVVAAFAAAATVFVTARIAKELGGGPFARFLAGLALAVLPISLALGSVYSMNVFDLLFWAILFWIVVRLLSGGDERLWLVFGLVAGVGLLNKISVLFLGFGLVVGLVLGRRWDVFRTRWLWIGGALAALVFLPHIVWQHGHDWPTLEFMANARRDKMISLPIPAFLVQTIQQTVVASWLWILGLGWLLLAREAVPFRTLGFLFLTVVAILTLTGGKPYYLAAAYGAPLAAGAVALERATAGATRWARPVLAVLVLAGGLLLSPFGRPVLAVDTYVRYGAVLGIGPSTDERKEVGRLSQFYADMHGWRQMAETVSGVVRALPAEERAEACIFAGNYGEAGAMEYFGPALALPPTLSAHNSYWLWGPGRCTGEMLLVLGVARERIDELFETVELGATVSCLNCMPYESNLPIWVGRGLKVSLPALWGELRHFQ